MPMFVAGKAMFSQEWTNQGCEYVRKHYDSGNMRALQREATADAVQWLQVISSAPGGQRHLDGQGALARVRGDNAAPTAALLDVTGLTGRAYGARTQSGVGRPPT
jgi:hypothetical protein